MNRPWSKTLALIAALAAVSAAAATDGCPPSGPGPGITVTFQDRSVRTDDSLGTEQLAGLAGKAGIAQHHVLGLTHAQPDFHMTGAMRITRDEAGHTCIAQDIAVTLSLSELTVYLAQEIGDSCRRQVIREHEAEHVLIWQQYLRAGARLLEAQLRGELAAPHSYPATVDAEASERQWITALLQEKMRLLSEQIAQAQREIDSPNSYARVTSRLRACPPPS